MNSLPSPHPPLSPAVPVASRAALRLAELGVFVLTALVVNMPSGLLPFGVCLLGSLGYRNKVGSLLIEPGTVVLWVSSNRC